VVLDAGRILETVNPKAKAQSSTRPAFREPEKIQKNKKTKRVTLAAVSGPAHNEGGGRDCTVVSPGREASVAAQDTTPSDRIVSRMAILVFATGSATRESDRRADEAVPSPQRPPAR
jgi:hypothetical protein